MMPCLTEYDFRLNDPCGHISCGKGWCREPEASRRLRDLELWFVWRGRGWMKTQEHQWTLLPGFCALMRPGGIYDAGHDEKNPLGITFIHFDLFTKSKNRKKMIYSELPEFFEIDDVDYFDAVTRRITQLFPRNVEVGNLLLRGVLEDLFQRPYLGTGPVSTQERFHSQRITQMMTKIRSEESHFPTVQEMADELHISPAHFSRLFKKLTQQSPIDFILETRLARARHFLRETQLSIGEIADKLGYGDVYFFSRQFKQKTGVSPLAYRVRGVDP